MQEQLKLLEELQKIDAILNEKKGALTGLPAKLKSLKEDVARVETLLEGERARLQEAENCRRELEDGIRTTQDQANKSKSRLSQVRTSKEYMATQRELDGTRKSSHDREDELLKLMEALEQSRRTVEANEKDLAALKEHVLEEERETAERVERLRVEAVELQGQRDVMAQGVRKDLLRQYVWIQERRANAVVPARHGVCTGCNMQLPPQLFIVLQRGESVEQCPSCHRIVYFGTDEPEAHAPAAHAAELNTGRPG